MPPANDVGIGLTRPDRGGLVALGKPSFDGGGVMAGEVLLLLGGDLLLDRSSRVLLCSILNLFADADKLKSVGDIFRESLNFDDS